METKQKGITKYSKARNLEVDEYAKERLKNGIDVNKIRDDFAEYLKSTNVKQQVEDIDNAMVEAAEEARMNEQKEREAKGLKRFFIKLGKVFS